MKKLNICLMFTVAVAVLAITSGPTLATWDWTSSSPLVFDFDDNVGMTYVNPTNSETLPNSNWPFMTSSNDPTIKFCNGGQQCMPVLPAEMWYSFNGESLKLQRQKSSGFCPNYFSYVILEKDIKNGSFINTF
ncbi:MAG: hypothetical protein GX811_13410 [Lentisphaerae bacterium]|nr:hypothetical protein [Lentisphaerota bacterium]